MVESKGENWEEDPDLEFALSYDKINAEYEALVGKLEALTAAPLEKKYSLEKKKSTQEDPALVQWEFGE